MSYTIICASHSDEILNANLARSPMIAEGSVPLHLRAWRALCCHSL